MRQGSTDTSISRHIVQAMLLCCLLCLLGGCTAARNDQIVLVQTVAYERSLEASLSTDEFARFMLEQKEATHFPYRFSRSLAAEAYDIQAAPLTRACGSSCYWYPHYSAAVVLALDRDRTGAAVRGWEDLLHAGEEVSLPLRDPDIRLVLGAISFALDDDFSMKGAMALLSRLQRGGFLKQDDPFAPIQICFDHEAAALLREGRNLEIVVPMEGTLNFTKGLLSHSALSFSGDLHAGLLQAGFRLPDGRCDSSIYPPASEYARAVTLSDYSRLNEAGEGAWRRFCRSVLHSRFYAPADNRESVFSAMVFILVTIAWGGHMMRRIMGRRFRILGFTMVLLLVLWVALRIFKWQTPADSVINRYCWYGYYIFLLGLPLTLLRLADVIGRGEEAPTPSWWKVCLGINIVLLLTVLTNDLHMQIFHMDISAADWASHYSYGWLYYILWGINAVFFLGAVAVLVVKGWNRPRKKGMALTVVFSFLILVYLVLYGMRIPLARESDFAITMGFISLLFLQTAIFSGLIPVNSKYALLFTHSPLSMEILDAEGKTVFTSAAVSLPRGANLRFNAIRGGLAAWQEDLSAVHALQRGLAKTVTGLEKTNAVLRHEHRVLSDMEALAAKEKIQADLDALLGSRLAEIDSLLDNIGKNDKEDKNILARISLLLCYSKRRCHLMFWEKQFKSISSDELITYLSELGEQAKAVGVTCALIPAFRGDLKVDAAISCYSFLFNGLWLALERGQREIICHLSAQDDLIFMQLMGDRPFHSTGLEKEMLDGLVELREDGYLFQAVLKVAGGAASA